MDEQRVLLGRVSAAQGIKGWVKIYSYTDPLEQILSYQPWIMIRGSSSQTKRPCEGRKQGKGVVARFEDCETRDQAEEFIGYQILVERDALPGLEEGEYYWHQLEGLQVINLKGENLGRVDYLMNIGQRDTMVITADDSVVDTNNPKSQAKRQRFIPYVEHEIVKKVDLDVGQIQVDWGIDWD